MTEGPADQAPREEHDSRHAHPPEPEPLPRWVPVLIGVVLVMLAALAVVTGLRYRDQTLVGLVERRSQPPRGEAPAPPGEPEPGASRVFSGNVPQANAPVTGRSRAEISGDASGVASIVRMSARRGMRMRVEPPNAVVYVNDLAIGRAREFDSEDEVYDFPEPGSFDVRLIAPGYRERRFIVTAADDAPDEIAVIQAKLEKE